jgi:hypothetical protein
MAQSPAPGRRDAPAGGPSEWRNRPHRDDAMPQPVGRAARGAASRAARELHYLEVLPEARRERERAVLASEVARQQLAEAQQRSGDQFIVIDQKHIVIDPKKRPVDWLAW